MIRILTRRHSARGILLLTIVIIVAFLVPSVYALTLTNGQSASMVLGQADFTHNSPVTTQSGMDRPRAVVVEPTTGKIFVAEYGNNRVLRFASAAGLANGASAEAVLGQADFTHNFAATTQDGMDRPAGIAIDNAGRLWVVDQGNNRVLRFDNAASKANGANADGVLGQANFTNLSATTTQSGLAGPTGIAVDGTGRLWVVDRGNSRVLRFDNAASKANGANADGVLGQVNFTDNVFASTQSGMHYPNAAAADSAGRLWVADTLNNRVLRFDDAAAKANGANADGVLGQVNFTDNAAATTQSGMNFPHGLASAADGRLYVTTNDHRILWFDGAASKANGANADGVLGQPDFSTGDANHGGLSAAAVQTPAGAFYDPAGDVLWVADMYNNRVLMYGILNTAPTLSNIADQSAAEDIATGAIGFSVGDGQSAAGSLTLSGNSSNTTLVPNANIVFGGSGASRTVAIAPAANQHGSATITVTVSDGILTATDTFVLTVNAVNDAPTAGDGSLTTNEDSSASGALNAGDVDGNSLTYSIVANGSKGVAALTNAATGAYTYTPNADANGADSFTFRVNDGTLNSNVATVSITITPVNDTPLASNGGLSTNEDTSATGTLVASDVDGNSLTYSIVANGSQGVATITNTATGALSYIPNANANGSDSITFKVNDGTAESTIATVSITITPVNDIPAFTKGAAGSVAEDASAQSASGWASGLSAGPADESIQTLGFLVTNDNPALFAAQPAVAPNGTLTYTPAANANGSAVVTVQLQDNGGTANGGVDTSATQTFTITITPVDDAPTLDALADVSLNESAPLQTLNLSGIGAGPADESSQALVVAATSSNPALIANPSINYTSPSANGTLSFTPVAGMSGSATISVSVTDNGGNVAPNANSFTRTFVVFVGAVNNRPTLDQPADLSLLEDAGAQSINLTGIEIGSLAEVGQILTVTATSSNPALVANPSVAYTSPNASGVLSFTPAANGNGTATISVTVRDDGGTLNGGIDTITRVFTITVAPVNDAPSFIGGANQTVSALGGPQTVAGWASGFTSGPANEVSQTLLSYQVVSNSQPGLFAVAPALASDGTLTYTPAQGAGGTATIGIIARDSGGTANGGVTTSAVKTFTITVQPGYRTYLPCVVKAGASGR